jgi:hypothetical protein
MVIEAGLAGAPLVVILAPAGDGDQGHAPAPRLLADAAADLQAV